MELFMLPISQVLVVFCSEKGSDRPCSINAHWIACIWKNADWNVVLPKHIKSYVSNLWFSFLILLKPLHNVTLFVDSNSSQFCILQCNKMPQSLGEMMTLPSWDWIQLGINQVCRWQRERKFYQPPFLTSIFFSLNVNLWWVLLIYWKNVRTMNLFLQLCWFQKTNY